MSPTPLEAAMAMATDAGALIRSFHEHTIDIQSKGQSYNLVTEADLQAERLIMGRIGELFPDHEILSEEAGGRQSIADHMWVIDPLDGTNNFAHGFPFFAVSIAYYNGAEPKAGVVYDVVRDELFHAEQGKGAFCNGRPIHVSAARTLEKSILATGFYYDRGEMMKRTLRQIEAFFTTPIRGIRRTGSAAIDQCFVACGRLDGFWELRLSPWDYAAGSLILSEAGGHMTRVDGAPFDLFMQSVCASNGVIHDAMLEVLSRA